MVVYLYRVVVHKDCIKGRYGPDELYETAI